jgi:hypothetical protein
VTGIGRSEGGAGLHVFGGSGVCEHALEVVAAAPLGIGVTGRPRFLRGCSLAVWRLSMMRDRVRMNSLTWRSLRPLVAAAFTSVAASMRSPGERGSDHEQRGKQQLQREDRHMR